MMREEFYEEEFYGASREHGFQDAVNEALRQAPWWLVSVAAHGVMGVVLMLAHFTEYTVDKATVVNTVLEEQEDDKPLEEKERDVFDKDPEFVTDEVKLNETIIKEVMAEHVEKDDNEDFHDSKGMEDMHSFTEFKNKYGIAVIGTGAGGGGAWGHRHGGNRDLGAYGGSPRTQSAVNEGLNWLRDHQNPDGMWSCTKFSMNCKRGCCTGAGSHDEYDMGVSGLALLAFLGAGHTHKHGRYKSTVKMALRAVIDRQGPDGCLGPKSADGHWIYNHTIASMALAEAYGLSNRSALLQAPAQRAVDFLVECQNPYLGWRYGFQTGESDSSVTGWAVLALKSAALSGLHVPKECFDGALNWFEKVTDEAYYKTGYTARGDTGARLAGAMGKFQPSEAMTAAALTGRIFAMGRKAQNRPEIMGAGNILTQSPPKWDVKGGTIDMYYWYYGTLAMFQLGGRYWKAWNGPMKNALVPTQKREGCENGSWDPVGAWGSAGGRVYATAINILSLEIYYRYGRVLNVK